MFSIAEVLFCKQLHVQTSTHTTIMNTVVHIMAQHITAMQSRKTNICTNITWKSLHYRHL